MPTISITRPAVNSRSAPRSTACEPDASALSRPKTISEMITMNAPLTAADGTEPVPAELAVAKNQLATAALPLLLVVVALCRLPVGGSRGERQSLLLDLLTV